MTRFGEKNEHKRLYSIVQLEIRQNNQFCSKNIIKCEIICLLMVMCFTYQFFSLLFDKTFLINMNCYLHLMMRKVNYQYRLCLIKITTIYILILKFCCFT